MCIKGAHEHTGSAGASRPSLRNGFTAYFVLSPVNGSFATVAPEKLASQELDASTAASGPHDFTVCVGRVRLAPPASTASHRAFVTMANAPLVGETTGVMELIWVAREAEYFCARGWTAFADLPVVPIGRMRERQSALALQANQPAAGSPHERSDMRGSALKTRMSLRSSGLRLLFAEPGSYKAISTNRRSRCPCGGATA